VMKSIHKLRRRERLRAEVHEPEQWTPGTDERANLRRLRLRLAEKLQQLSPERRNAVVLHHVEGYGVAEIAELTDAPINTVRDRLRQGRKLLRKKIKTDPTLREWVEAMER
jgi:RNA polymerase sigma-70 factor (ECF subfamily)